MSNLLFSSNSPLPCLPLLHDLAPLGKACRINLLVRNRNRQQEIDRHAERAGELLMQRDGTFALSSFEVRQVALRNADSNNQLCLFHLAPFAQNSDRICSSRQAINDDFGQNDLGTGGDGGACVTHDPGRADILADSQSGKPIVFALRQNGEFLATRGLDELHFGHDALSIINFAAMPDGGNNDGFALDIKYDAPVDNTQPRSGSALEPLHVAMCGLGEYRKFGLNSPAHIGGKTEPLARSRAGERDLHPSDIAEHDSFVKGFIALCYMWELS